VTLGVKRAAIVRIVVLGETAVEVAGLSNVDLSLGIHEDVNTEYRRGI
jgi:hypothetical protein